jgi:hypothetical protein
MAADRRLVEQLRSRQALTQETAQAVEARPGLERRRLALLVRKGIIVETGTGRYFLVEAAWAEDRARARRMLTWVLILAMIALAVVVFRSR